MSEPRRLGDTFPAPTIYRVAKHCPRCGLHWTGTTFTPLRPNEDERLAWCDACITCDDRARTHYHPAPPRRQLRPPASSDPWEQSGDAYEGDA